MAEPTTAPFSTYRTRVREEWMDYNGHMHDASYAVLLSDANEELFEALDLSAGYREAAGASLFTVECRIRYLASCSLGQLLHAATSVVSADAKRVRLYTELLDEDGRVVATGEHLYLHVDLALGKVVPLPDDRQRRVAQLLVAPAQPLGTEETAGRLATPYEGRGHRPWDTAAPIPAPLRLHETSVSPAWVDYNGHMSESCYLLVFGDNADAFFRFLGIDEKYRAGGHSLYTVQTHLHHRREVGEGEPLSLTLQVLDSDARRVHVFAQMLHGRSGLLLATAEQMLVHVDARQGRSVPLPEDLRARICAVRRAHASLPRPEVVGKPMGIRRPPAQPAEAAGAPGARRGGD